MDILKTLSLEDMMAQLQGTEGSNLKVFQGPPVASDGAARMIEAVYATEAGRALIEHFLTLTLRRFDMPLLGMPIEQVAVYAAYREGQRDIGLTFLRLFARAQELNHADQKDN
ncbi:MAG: hypothetical protein RLZZ157_67 [Pseudomonadota bacterium]|jgi:hypothetical protein